MVLLERIQDGTSEPIPNQDTTNKFPAMIFYGGSSDVIAGYSFEMASRNDDMQMVSLGHFAFLCNHDMGHTIPIDATASVWRFLQDHAFGTDPSPYVGGLPTGFPSYCSL